MLKYYYYCHIYLSNIHQHMKSPMCTELQNTQLLLSLDVIMYKNVLH